MKSLTLSLVSLALVAGCSSEIGSPDLGTDADALGRGNAGTVVGAEGSDAKRGERESTHGTSSKDKPVCTGNEPPRASIPATLTAAANAKTEEWKKALEVWSSNPEAFASARAIAGKECTSNSDCVTGTDLVTAYCSVPYYNRSQCMLNVDAFGAPAAPRFHCGVDWSCTAGYECEEEENTGAVACVEHKTCVEPGTTSGGNGNGNGGGRRK
ncbi:MAG: hypothetical protein U0169_04505 [Polyangiaceae bacterium]